MHSKKFIQWLLPLVPLTILGSVWYVFFSSRGGSQIIEGLTLRDAALKLFPVFGLTAFSLVWTQLMLGSLMPWVRNVYPGVERYHRWQGPFVLMFATLHPLWLLVGLGLASYWSRDYLAASQKNFVWFGYTGLFMMWLTVATALLRRWTPLRRWWHRVHYLNYVLFYSVWIHSWNLGTDIRTTWLRYVWLFCIITVTAAVVIRIWPRRPANPVIPPPVSPSL